MGLDLNRLNTDHDRAALMFDYASDPRGLVADLLSALSEAGYGDGEGAHRLPADVCRPFSGTVGAAMLYEVWQRVSESGEVTGYDYEETMVAAQTIVHAADHGDSLAQALVGLQFPEVIQAIEDWVLGQLAEDMSNVVELFAHAGDFDAWEGEES